MYPLPETEKELEILSRDPFGPSWEGQESPSGWQWPGRCVPHQGWLWYVLHSLPGHSLPPWRAPRTETEGTLCASQQDSHGSPPSLVDAKQPLAIQRQKLQGGDYYIMGERFFHRESDGHTRSLLRDLWRKPVGVSRKESFQGTGWKWPWHHQPAPDQQAVLRVLLNRTVPVKKGLSLMFQDSLPR